MRLIGRTSSINVRKVLWTAEEIGIDFEHQAVADRSDELLRLNPNGLVPVWIDETGPLWESNTICRYLAARFAREDLLPSSPAARAQVEKWMDWQAAELNPAWRYAFMALVRRHPDFRDSREVERSVDGWNRLMTVLDERLAQTAAYVAGRHFTLADVVIGLSVHRWSHTPMDHPELPAIAAYTQRLSTHSPAFAKFASSDLP
jgi:glutathione S-transferase